MSVGAIRGADVSNAAVQMLVVVPVHKPAHPGSGGIQINKSLVRELQPILGGTKQALDECIVVANPRARVRGLNLLLEVHLLEAPVVLFQLLEPGHHGNIHPAVFGSPLVKRGRADPQFTAHIGNPKASIDRFQRLHDLGVAISGLLHLEPFPLE